MIAPRLRVFVRLKIILLLACVAATTSVAVSLPAARAQFDFGNLGGFGGGLGSGASEVSFEAQFTAPTADQPAVIFVTAKIAPKFHIYAIDQAPGGPLKTTVQLAQNAGAELLGSWQAIEQPNSHVDEEIWVGLELREHERQVTWFAPIRLEQTENLDSVAIEVSVEGQACSDVCVPFEETVTAKLGDGMALPPGALELAGVLQDSVVESGAPAKMIVDEVPALTTGNEYDLSKVVLTRDADGSFVYYLITAFLGGIVLNVMPCVLPVIGLKVMSFVQQAGQSRAQAWALNCWYSAGIVSVFLVLASLAVSLQLSWGGQFGSAQFNITLIGVVFAMALSLLGLWDIPIPGFVGSGAAIHMAEREGPTAAFLKGVLTTVLATPCTGPFMATALAWAVKQPAWMTYSVFGALGMGMASPYLLIGAFPSLVRFLPKPGAWMESFKKIMGLVLLATVVWLLSFIEFPLVVPTVALMVGIAAACWWISHTPITATLSEKLFDGLTAVLVVAVTALGSYGWLYPDVMVPRFKKNVEAYAEQQIGEERVRITRALAAAQDEEQLAAVIADITSDVADADGENWQRFTLAKLQQLAVEEHRTVIVDFTADWCTNCIVLEKAVLKTREVEEALTRGDVVTMEADFTKRPEAIDRTIKALGGVGVPVVAIFPGSAPHHPIVFAEGKYTKQGLLDAIAQATAPETTSPGNTALSQAAGDPRL